MFGTIVYFHVPTDLTHIIKGYVLHIAQVEQNISDFFKNRIEYIEYVH